MKRLHVHISVDDLGASKRFYSALFGQEPSVDRADYAKWEVADPRVNLSVSQKTNRQPGVNHLGVQAETTDELSELHARLAEASVAMRDEPAAQCCYARSDKHWAADPQGVVWEMFRTMGAIETYGQNRLVPGEVAAADQGGGCC